MTTTDPNPDEQKRGRHAKRDDPERPAADEAPANAAHRADDGDDDAEQEQDDQDDQDERAEPPADENAGADEEPGDEEPEEEPVRYQKLRDLPPGEEKAPRRPTAEEQPPAEEQAPPRAEKPREQPREQPRDEAPPKPSRTRFRHSLPHHPAGASLLTAAGLVTGLTLVPLLFDQLNFEVATRAADTARSAAAPWPAGGEPWFWPGWMATTAAIVAVLVLVVAAVGLKLPDVAVLAMAAVLAVTTARAAWATFAVLNAHLWELVPVVIVCLLAFGSAAAAVFRWRSPEGDDAGSGAGEVAGVTLGSWLLVVLLLLGGSAIASSAETHAFGNVTSPPQNLAGLLSVRAADAPELHDLRGSWVAQVDAAQVGDDAAASAYAVRHHDWTTRFPTLLARGDDVDNPGLDDTWWLSLAAQPFGSQAEAAAWCSTNGLATCVPLLVSG